MNPTGKGGFQQGHKFGQGGARPGAGRKLQPTPKELRKMKLYLGLLLVSDFKLMAHLEKRPQDFADQVQFGGSEQDAVDANGKAVQTRTGAYKLDPLFQARLDLLKFRLSKYTTGAPKELDVNVEQKNIWMILQHIESSSNPSQTLSSMANGSSNASSTTGNEKLLECSSPAKESPDPSVTEEVKAVSSPSSEAGFWLDMQKRESS